MSGRRHLDIPKLLQVLGIHAERDGSRLKARCPNPEHNDSDPSWSICFEGDEAGGHHCFPCGFGGGPWELVARVKGCSLEEAGKWLRTEFKYGKPILSEEVPEVVVRYPVRNSPQMQLPFGVVVPSWGQGEWEEEPHRYLVSPYAEGGRGLAPWQVERWNLGYALRGRCRRRVVVPIFTKGRLVSYVARAYVDDPKRYDVAWQGYPGARPEIAIFGEELWEDSPVATVAEGVFGMLAFERAGAPNPCAILGASNLGPEKLEMLAQHKLILVGTDPDEAGDKAFETIRVALHRWTEVRRISLAYKPDEAPMEALQAGLRAATMRRRKVWPTAEHPSGS